MSLCINPICPQPNNPSNQNSRFCQSCGSDLLITGRYRVMSLLSDKTGFGKIYEASEASTPKILKVLKEELNNNDKAVELFQQEANVLGQLHHLGIPKVDGYFQYQSKNSRLLHCIVMEKIYGSNLDEWLQQRENQPINQEQAIAWLKQLAEILALVHGKNYLHRDIKPSNIMLTPSGQLVLIDFGTAREMTYTYLAKRGMAHGVTSIESRGYTAPEQANGQAVPQSDFFSLGRTFVHLLTGRYPLDMYDPGTDALNWRGSTINISPLLLDLIDWLMARNFNDRPKNAQTILQRLKEIEIELAETVNVLGALKKRLTTMPVFTRQQNKLPLLIIVAIFLLLGSLAALALFSPAARCFAGSSSKVCRWVNRPPGQPPQRKGKVDFFPYQEGTDSQGRTAEFNIAVLSIEYKWKLGSAYQIQYNDRVINVDELKSTLEEQGIQRIMENPTEIIAVGTASCEGSPALEERRALERAKQIQLLAKRLFGNLRSVQGYRLLNLGQFTGIDCQPNQEFTSYQRSLIIMGVKNKTEGVILDEALRSRLEKKPFADFSLEDYSLGSPDKFKTIPSNL